MKLRALMLASATGMVATAVTVWATIPAHKAAASPTPASAPIAAPTPPPDHSHFQAGKTLMVEGRLGHPILPASVDSETFLFVDVTGTAVAPTNPAPLDLSIVIDRSGSMAGKRLTNALAAARTAIQRLRDGDVVSVISFNTTTEVVAKPTTIDFAARARLVSQLAAIHAGGDTCISCGIDTAMHLLAERDNMVNRILLLSDGIPTAGVRDVEGFQRIAENCRTMSTSVTTIGVDVEYDEKVMSALARSSNGHHFFVADPTGLPTIFDQEMRSLTRTVANRAELAIDLAPGVTAEQVFDRVTTNNGSQVVVPFGAFSAGEHKTLLVRLRVPRGTAGERPVAALRLHYDDLADGKPGNCEGLLATRLSSDPSALSPLDGLVSARVSATETATVLEDANKLFKAGKADEARAVIAGERQRIMVNHSAAKNAAPADRMGDLDTAFTKTEKTLAGAGSGFVAAPAGMQPRKPDADKPGQMQVRENQAAATDATE